MIFERVQTGLVLVLRLNTILGFQYRASTRPSLQTFKTRLENESRVGTPIRQNLVNLDLQSLTFCRHLLSLCRHWGESSHNCYSRFLFH